MYFALDRINARHVRDFTKAIGRLAKTDTPDAEAITAFTKAFQTRTSAISEIRGHILIQITQNNNLKETISDTQAAECSRLYSSSLSGRSPMWDPWRFVRWDFLVMSGLALQKPAGVVEES